MSARAATYVALLISLLLAMTIIFAAVIYATRLLTAANRDAASRRNVERVLRTFQSELEYMRPRVRDWAMWDDTYDFVQTRDPAYVESNLTPDIMDEMEMDVLVISDAQGGIVWGRTSSALSEKARASSDDIVRAAMSGGRAPAGDGATATCGVIRVGGVAMLVSSLPISRSNGDGPFHGSLVMGRALLPATLARLAEQANSPFAVYEPGDARLPKSLGEVSATALPRAGTTSSPGGPLAIPGYGALVDRQGSPVLVLSSLEPETSFSAAAQGVAALMAVLLIVGIAWGGATLTFVERTSLSRMTWLRNAVADIASGRRRDYRIDLDAAPVHDDVWIVAAEVNSMLDALDESKRAFEANQEFFAKASHELRTPLNSVIGFASLLSRGMAGPLNEEQTRQVRMILSSGTHLLALTNDLLDMEKLNADATLDLAECDFDRLVQGCVETIRPLAVQKTLDLCVDVGGAGRGRADCRRIEQAVLNLLGNAVKFTDKGTITVRTSLDDGWIEIEVSDTGRGIPPSLLPRVFDKFVSTVYSDRPSGTGLGLSITRQIARLHGGTVTVTSTEGEGSSFVFRLPAEPPVVEPGAADRAPGL